MADAHAQLPRPRRAASLRVAHPVHSSVDDLPRDDHTVGQGLTRFPVSRVAHSLTWQLFYRLQACRAASVESSPPLWRAHERRVARASAQRRARLMVVLSGRLLSASAWAAAGAGGAGSQLAAACKAAAARVAALCSMLVARGMRAGFGVDAAGSREACLCPRAERWLACRAHACRGGWPRCNVWILHAFTLDC